MLEAGRLVGETPSPEAELDALEAVDHRFDAEWPPATELFPDRGQIEAGRLRVVRMVWAKARIEALIRIEEFTETAAGLEADEMEFEADRLMAWLSARARLVQRAILRSGDEGTLPSTSD